MKNIIFYESKEELENNLQNIKLKSVEYLEFHDTKVTIINIEQFLFYDYDFRNDNLFLCSSIRKNESKSDLEYFLWDNSNWDFYKIEQKDVLERIERWLRER